MARYALGEAERAGGREAGRDEAAGVRLEPAAPRPRAEDLREPEETDFRL